MSVEACAWALHAGGINPAAKLLLIVLSDVADSGGVSIASRTYLTRLALLDGDAMEARLRDLESAGLIERLGASSQGEGREAIRLLIARRREAAGVRS